MGNVEGHQHNSAADNAFVLSKPGLLSLPDTRIGQWEQHDDMFYFLVLFSNLVFHPRAGIRSACETPEWLHGSGNVTTEGLDLQSGE